MCPDEISESPEIPLTGGVANTGRVVRVGDEVARPRYPQTPTVELFLDHLFNTGITFVPRPRGIDAKGRQRLSYVEGTVPAPPLAAWALNDALLVDVARRQAELHRAAGSFVAPPDATWATSAGDYFPAGAAGPLVCHNDLGMSNTVVNVGGGTVAGFVDFDYCRPVNRLFDIAVAARHWVPFGDVAVAEPVRIDRLGRFALFCDVHRLDLGDRGTVVDLACAFLDQARTNIRALAAQGKGSFQTLLDGGYEETNRATVSWLIDNRSALTTRRL